jgi:hypothetical protein
VKTVVILQSSYIPWKGFFDLISRCDEFVLFDDTQFTRRDWRSRNRIKTANGPQWLTISVESKGKYEQLINQVKVADSAWAQTHWQSIRHAYAKAPHFAAQEGWVRGLYEAAGKEPMLSRINELFIREISAFLGLGTTFTWSQDYPGVSRRTERLVEICRQAGATDYLSGPSARAYIEPRLFEEAGIELHYIDYQGYAEYPQLHGPFVHEVSMLDAIFNLGADARLAMRKTQ